MDIDRDSWTRNKAFFGTSNPPDQMAQLLDIVSEQNQRIEELEEQIAELLLLVEEEEPKEPKKK